MCSSGTGSKPPPFQGWQRPSRRIASQSPRRTPCVSSASSVYCRARRVEAAPGRQVHAHEPPRPDRQHEHAREARTEPRRARRRRRSSPLSGRREQPCQRVGESVEGHGQRCPVGAETRYAAPGARCASARPRPPPAAGDGAGCASPRCRRRRRRTPLSPGSRPRRGTTPDRDRARARVAAPGRGRRKSHGRERARSGRQARAAALASRLEHGPTARGMRIRDRNPCSFLRFRLFGWKVRFTHGLLEKGRPRDPRSGAANESGGPHECTATRETVAQRGRRATRTVRRRATLVCRETPVLGSNFSPAPRPRRRTSPKLERPTCLLGRLLPVARRGTSPHLWMGLWKF